MFFIKIPITVYDEKQETLFGDGYSNSEAELLKSSIEHWFTTNDEDGKECVRIGMKSGVYFTAKCSKNEFLKRLVDTYQYATVDKTTGGSN